MILNEEGKIEFLESNFHPYFDIQLSSNITEENITQFVNFVLPISTINQSYAILTDMRSFFNDDFTNVIFTSADEKYLYRYECYQDVYFIRMQPFRSTIRMHILPKKYDASNAKTDSSILIFKDNKQNIDSNNFNCTEEYERHTDGANINLYYKEDEQDFSNGMYKFDIKEKTKNFKNLQINLGYSYNDTNPTNPLEICHYTGVLDESDENGTLLDDGEFTKWNLSLMDANYDNISLYTNTSKRQKLVNGSIQWPTNTTPYDDGEDHTLGFNNSHTINTLYHKTIKYFNGDIYIEENNHYLIQLWTEAI